MKNLRLQKNEEGYSLIVRLNDDLKPVAVEPYVVVSGYDEKTETWDSGSYHQDLEKALDDFNYGKRISYDRMLKIATSLIENALADSVINTLDTLTEFGVTKEEAEELGINTHEVLEDYDYDFE